MPEPLNALGAQVAAQTRALDECQREKDMIECQRDKLLTGLQKVVSFLEQDVKGMDTDYLHTAYYTIRESNAIVCAKKALEEADDA